MVKVLLVPLAIIAFVLFLLAIGAFGLFVAMAVISACGQLWRAASGGGRALGRRRGGRP